VVIASDMWCDGAVSEQLEVLKLIAGRLDAARVPYMITGSIAAGLYGQPRMTRDIDIVVALAPVLVTSLVEQLDPEFIHDAELIRTAVAERRIFSVVHRSATQKVDFIVRTDDDYEIEKFDRRRQVDVDGQPMWLIAAEDLVLSKLVWAKQSRSELQFRDIRSIVAVQPRLDWPYIDRWATRLTVAKLPGEFRS
jgi:hypothetical protein